MNSPSISVIMPLRDAAPFVRDTLASLLAQTFEDFELLVVDDGSTDGGPESIRDVNDPRIHFLTTAGGAGPAAARNLGLDASRGEFIAFADADDIALPERLAMQLSVLRREPALGFVGSRVDVIAADGSRTGRRWGFAGADALLAPTLLFRNALSTSTLLLRRECIGTARFRADLPIASDYELWTRLSRTSAGRVLLTPLVQYRDHLANLTHRRQAESERCLREIAAAQLRELAIEATPDELTLHRQLATRHECSRDFVDRAEAWLLRIRAGRGIRDQAALDTVLAQLWTDVCRAAAALGLWSWRRHRASPLGRRATLGFAAKVARGELKLRFARGGRL